MKAVIEPLVGEYDGTHITVTFNDGFSSEFMTFKCEGNREPSSRQLNIWGISKKQWNNNETVNFSFGKMKAQELLRMNKFYETKQAFIRALAVAKAINNA